MFRALFRVWVFDAFNPRKRELARFARCSHFAAAAAASRPQATSPNIIVFVVRGLTFVNVVVLYYVGNPCVDTNSSGGQNTANPCQNISKISECCYDFYFRTS